MRAEPAPLRVRLLGGLVVEGHAEHDLGSRKARTVLKVLALARGTAVSVSSLAEVLWGDRPPARPSDQVGVLVSRLRGVIGRDRLIRSDAGFVLVVDWLDIDELAALVEEADGALGDARVAAARAAATAAVTLARGPLLPDEDGDWVTDERVRVDGLLARAMELAATAALAAGDRAAAEASAEAALVRDPYDESALRVLMRAQAAAGRPGSALASYARVRERLAEDLGVSPVEETEALHTAVLVGQGPTRGAALADATAPSPLVGRDDELEALAGHLAAAHAGEVRLVVVEGEAGIGKTTLVGHFAGLHRSAGGAR